jgi:predicted  nucleic acid-binding Zn-ribbon protein
MNSLEKGSIIALLADCRKELIELREENKNLKERIWRLKEDLSSAEVEIKDLENMLYDTPST